MRQAYVICRHRPSDLRPKLVNVGFVEAGGGPELGGSFAALADGHVGDGVAAAASPCALVVQVPRSAVRAHRAVATSVMHAS